MWKPKLSTLKYWAIKSGQAVDFIFDRVLGKLSTGLIAWSVIVLCIYLGVRSTIDNVVDPTVAIGEVQEAEGDLFGEYTNQSSQQEEITETEVINAIMPPAYDGIDPKHAESLKKAVAKLHDRLVCDSCYGSHKIIGRALKFDPSEHIRIKDLNRHREDWQQLQMAPPATWIRTQDDQVSWNEQQFFRFYKTIDGGPERKRGDSECYEGHTKLIAAERHHTDDQPLMMLKRVVFADDLEGDWKHQSSSRKTVQEQLFTTTGKIRFLEKNRFEETRLTQLKMDDPQSEDWTTEFHLQGTWLVKPSHRKVVLYIDTVVVEKSEGCSERYVEQERQQLFGMHTWDIEEFQPEEMTVALNDKQVFVLRKQ